MMLRIDGDIALLPISLENALAHHRGTQSDVVAAGQTTCTSLPRLRSFAQWPSSCSTTRKMIARLFLNMH